MELMETQTGTDQKLDTLLNLALHATADEIEKLPGLEVGFDPQKRTWELIVKYSGNIKQFARKEIQIEILSPDYAIVEIPENEIYAFSRHKEIEYIEKPKRLYFEENVRTNEIERKKTYSKKKAGTKLGLTGKGVLIAVLDSGVDFFHPEFRNADGTTRILYYWDQGVPGKAPAGFTHGTEYTQEELNDLLKKAEGEEKLMVTPAGDLSGHGTAVLGIAAGNGGVAPYSSILVVKLARADPEGFPRTIELMRALTYTYRKAQELHLPVAVNISFGTVYGPHNGSSLLETYLFYLADSWKSVLVSGMGNEGTAAGHVSGRIEDRETIVECAIGVYERQMNIQLWKSYTDQFDIVLIHPNGEKIGPINEKTGTKRYHIGNTKLLIYYGRPSPYSISQEIFFAFLPEETYLDHGIWKICFLPKKMKHGRYDMWLPPAAVRNTETGFLHPDADNTLTIPASAQAVVAVGAYNKEDDTYADFSGRGVFCAQTFPDGTFLQKPDLAAPGVEIRTALPGGGYTVVTGTSFAVPFVTGAAALMMQWGIVEENDPYLYGEKVKAYLRKGARPIEGIEKYPDNRVGYGVLCVRDSIPV